uniref:Accessory gland protein Acp29AB-like n=1 Tax=Drosophila rhopaloa TaxID=1041015 RepID=A0A6P4FQB3_DRORH
AKLEKLLDQEEAASRNTNPLDLRTKLERIENQLEALQKSLSNKTKAGIPPLFKRIGSRLIYVEHEIEKSWNEAEETCRRMGGHLATIQDESDFTAIKGELKIYEHYWLGITDVAKNGEFISVASGKPAPFIKLRARSLSYYRLYNGCVEIFHGEMLKTSCSLPVYFICEAVG